MLSGNGADFARELAKNELFELDLGAGIVDIDAHKVSLGVVIEPSVGKGVVDSHFIRKRDNPQVAAPQFRNCAPEPVTIALLWLGTKRVVEDANAPLSL
jgi:hypothetical protein